LNRNVGELAEPGMFATFACVRLSEGRRAECALAGHLPILRFDATRGVLGRIENEHLPLGVSQDERYEAKEVACGAGDLLVLLTDGLTEVQDSHGKELGLAAMEATIAEHAAEPLERLHERIVGVARDHGRQLDDQTLV